MGSTSGMQQTMKTSVLYQAGRQEFAKQNETKLLTAIATRDFPLLAEVTMRESNQLHAACLDTWPPCVYLNETSYSIMRFVHLVNAYFKRSMVCPSNVLGVWL